MKDATGELSMTAVAVVAIAAIASLFTLVIWPQIKKSINRSMYCSQAISCEEPTGNATTVQCTYCTDDSCEETGTIACPVENDGFGN